MPSQVKTRHVHCQFIPSSYPKPPNYCMEVVIDHVMRTCMLAHWIKPRNITTNQRSSFQRFEGAYRVSTMLTHSHAEGQSSMNNEGVSDVYRHNQPRPLDISLGTVGMTMIHTKSLQLTTKFPKKIEMRDYERKDLIGCQHVTLFLMLQNAKKQTKTTVIFHGLVWNDNKPKLCSEAVVYGVYKMQIFIQCSCLINCHSLRLCEWTFINKTRMLLPYTGRKIADWLLCGFVQYDYFHILTLWSITH